jgi:HAD superfamily hydrolase (TIGR01509 family)
LIKAVFFDYDGVLTTDKTGSQTTTRYLSAVTGIELSVVQDAFRRYNEDLTLGKTTHAQVWPRICRALGQELNIRLLHDAFESTPMNSRVFSLAHQLKERYSVGIITDNKKDRIDHLKACQGLASLFDPIVVSAEVGSDKGSTEIFLLALRHAGVSPEESVFIDNNKDNLEAPHALGIKTIFHDDDKNDIPALLRSLETLGVHARDA